MGLDTPPSLGLNFTPEEFFELNERDGIIPAPYMARNKWVKLEALDALGDRELKSLIKNSYEMVFSKLPKKTQAELGAGTKPAGTRKRRSERMRSS
jgi:predicted DNA-binding protein (MmcQ/YjbR family)